jgi:hypothetical protein
VNVVVLAEESARLSARTVNRMLSNVVGFYEFQARRGSTLAHDLVVKTRSGRGGYEPFLYGIARSRPRGRAVRLPERQSLPSTLSLEQVGAVIDCRERLRDRFLFALLASTGMRVGQALGLRHEDVVAWERRIVIRARDGAPRRARSKGGAEGGVPVPGELMRLWSDYMHEEYRDLDCDFSYSRLRNGWRALVCPPMSWAGSLERADRWQARHPAVAVPIAVVKKFTEDDAPGLGLQMAYWGFFSAFSLLLAFVSILGFAFQGISSNTTSEPRDAPRSRPGRCPRRSSRSRARPAPSTADTQVARAPNGDARDQRGADPLRATRSRRYRRALDRRPCFRCHSSPTGLRVRSYGRGRGLSCRLGAWRRTSSPPAGGR